MIHCLLYLIKILFELSLGISRITNFLELLNLGTLLVIVVTKYVEVGLKSNFEIDFANTQNFYDFQLLVSLEEVSSICLALCSFFYPFRILQFLAHFKLFQPAKTIINTICRTIPGQAIYFFLMAIMIGSWAQGIYISLSPMYPEFSTFGGSIVTMLSTDLQLLKVHHDLVNGYSHSDVVFDMSVMFIYSFKIFIAVFAIALMTNLYKKAMTFEKGHASIDPEKEAYFNQIDEIQDKVQQIFKFTNNSTESNDLDFKNQKLVAWLLNRKKEVQQQERKLFFKQINEELQSEFMFFNT